MNERIDKREEITSESNSPEDLTDRFENYRIKNKGKCRSLPLTFNDKANWFLH
jgi:hypothetical protein